MTYERGIFCQRLDDLLNHEHELVKLAQVIDWSLLEAKCGALYAEKGRSGVPIRLMAGLVMLQHTFQLSDDDVVSKWVENPYWQFFCGEEFFCHKLPINPSSLTRWRKRIGKDGMEQLLKLTIHAGQATKTITEANLQVVVVDTTVQPKAVAYPTDARLYLKVLHALVRIAKQHEIKLRQTYTKSAKEALFRHGQYRKAKQMNRAKKEQKKLKTYAGRVFRDLERKMDEETFKKNRGTMIMSHLVLTQEKKTKGKIYSVHAPEVECIAKGKAHKPYEFGVKASLATTAQGGFVVGMMSCPGNPYDGHTLADQLDQVERLTGKMPERCHVDKGYKGHGAERCQVIISGSRRGITKALKKEMRRRSSIEPEIGHQKADGKLGRNWLKGSQGDMINAVLCGVGANLRKILARLRKRLYLWLLSQLLPTWRIPFAPIACPQAA